MTARYRAEQVGSLLRPPELLQARFAHSEGRITTDALRAHEDHAIATAFDRQRQLGLDILTDGEMRRGSWLTDMGDAVEGFVAGKVLRNWKGPGGGEEASHAKAVGAKLRKARKMMALELPFLKENAMAPFKITIPAPSSFVIGSYKEMTKPFYPTPTDLLRDLVDIVRDEVRWLVSEGVVYIQFDAPLYSHYLDPKERDRMRQAGLDPDEEFDRCIAGDNAALQDIPRDGTVTRAMHICRGNSRSRWYAEGGYDAIAEKLFGSLDVDTFLLEYDTPRSGGFEPLRLVPDGKNIVLGLLTTKEATLESQDDLRRRIDEAAKYVPIDNLSLSPQCGFASVESGNLISVEDQWRKLELVVKTAQRVWG
jgi:5-methyltetrahydropteroyltriglutamate--homocysteine methyltransferase